MKAKFDNIDDYLTELALQAANGKLSIVRATISERNPTEASTAYRVISSFHDEAYFYEATIDCGRDDARGRNTPTVARDEAAATLERIKTACAANKVEFRAGAWEMN